jgi:transposase
MSRSLFWLSDEAWAAIEPHLPKNQPGARRVDDRRVISGIIHMLKCGGRWADCPSEYGPSTTVYNRWNRWSRRGIWTRILAALTMKAGSRKQDRSIAATSRPIAAPAAQKGGAGQCHWHLAWGPDNEDPRLCRCPWTATPPRPDARQHLGREGRGPADRRDHRHETGDRRPRL